MPKKRNVFLVIDSNSLMHRSFHALPPFSTKDGKVVNAVYGFVSTLLKSIKEFNPTHIAAVFDVPGGTFRHEKYKEYKATRERAAQELYDQFPIVHEVLDAMKIAVFEKAKYEADDLIGTIVSKKEKGIEYIILTADMDELQLVNEQTRVYRLRKGVNDFSLFDEKGVVEKYGITPNQVVDYKALRGDPSDNIPGVKGIGEKTATDLLQQFGDLETILKEAEKKNSKIKQSVREKLITYKSDALMSQDLAQIMLDAPITMKLQDAEWSGVELEKTRKEFQTLEFKSLMDRIPGQEKTQPKEEIDNDVVVEHKKKDSGLYMCVNDQKQFDAFLADLNKQRSVTVDTESTGTDPFLDELLGLSFSWKKGEAYYIPVDSKPKWLSALKEPLENSNIQKCGHNIKYDFQLLQSHGVTMRGITFDTMIAAYLIRPGLRQYGLDNVVFKEIGYRMQPIEDLIGKGKKQITMREVPLEKLSWYACEDADFTNQLVEILSAQLKEQDFSPLFNDIEMPLVFVLASMEKAGVAIDAPFLKKMEVEIAKRISSLQKKIYVMAGEEFNVSSPLQLKTILFDKLHLSTQGLSKTKTGISTAASELEKLQGQHEIIDCIMEYREITKLQSTYITTLPQLVNPKDKRLHTSYNQTVAVTGRLSSSDPNLQNIPIRTDLGAEIRKAFIAKPGSVILSADYSQVELRIIASLAKDEKMIEAFAKGEDIHRRTASYIFEVELDEVTDDMRSAAKEVNFGVLYGMGAWGLASRKKISREKARAFIEKYFSVYDQVYQFLEDTRVKAREDGYVETLMGRKRFLPDIYSSMPQVRAQAERMAVNFPVQGTAADLMKIAMIRISEKLSSVSPKTLMIMQVHDELVFDVPLGEEKIVAAFVQKEMQGVAKLSVPLLVDVSVGKNWGELEKLK